MLDRSVQFIEQEHVIERAPQVFVMASNAVAALADQEKIERKGGMRAARSTTTLHNATN